MLFYLLSWVFFPWDNLLDPDMYPDISSEVTVEILKSEPMIVDSAPITTINLFRPVDLSEYLGRNIGDFFREYDIVGFQLSDSDVISVSAPNGYFNLITKNNRIIKYLSIIEGKTYKAPEYVEDGNSAREL